MSAKIKISCDEATQICDKNQYGEASISEKIKLNIHLLLCKHCKAYTKQNSIITKLMGKYLDSCDTSKHLTVNEKEELQKNLKEKLKS
jgi:hypothetical protein